MAAFTVDVVIEFADTAWRPPGLSLPAQLHLPHLPKPRKSGPTTPAKTRLTWKVWGSRLPSYLRIPRSFLMHVGQSYRVLIRKQHLAKSPQVYP